MRHTYADPLYSLEMNLVNKTLGHTFPILPFFVAPSGAQIVRPLDIFSLEKQQKENHV